MTTELGGELSDFMPDWLERLVADCRERCTPGDLRVFFAERDGAPVATATAYVMYGSPIPIFTKPRAGVIRGVYVVPAWRRRGIGAAVTGAAIDWLKESGCAVVRLRSSTEGRPRYQRLGFQPSSEMELRFNESFEAGCRNPDSARGRGVQP